MSRLFNLIHFCHTSLKGSIIRIIPRDVKKYLESESCLSKFQICRYICLSKTLLNGFSGTWHILLCHPLLTFLDAGFLSHPFTRKLNVPIEYKEDLSPKKWPWTQIALCKHCWPGCGYPAATLLAPGGAGTGALLGEMANLYLKSLSAAARLRIQEAIYHVPGFIQKMKAFPKHSLCFFHL